MEVDITLFDAIKNILRYEIFLRELCINKIKIARDQNDFNKLTPILDFTKKNATKMQRPRNFTIPYKIGDFTGRRAMLDLGNSVNAMSYLVYESLNFGSLND